MKFKRIAIGSGLVITIVALLVVWQLPAILNKWLPGLVSNESFQLNSLNVEHVGLRGARISEVDSNMSDTYVSARNTRLGYRPMGLFRGSLESVEVENLWVEFELPELVAEKVPGGLPGEPTPLLEEPFPEIPIPEERPPEDTIPEEEIPDRPGERPEDIPPGPRRVESEKIPPEQTLLDSIYTYSFNRLNIGNADIILQGNHTSLELGANLQAWESEGGLEVRGEIGNELHNVTFMGGGQQKERSSLTLDLVMEDASFIRFLGENEYINPADFGIQEYGFGHWDHSVYLSGNNDGITEFSSDLEIQDLKLETGFLEPALGFPLVVLSGGMEGEQIQWEGGVRFGGLSLEGLEVGSFAVNIGTFRDEPWHFETEKIDVSYEAARMVFGLRGEVSPPSAMEDFAVSGRLGVESLAWESYRTDPFVARWNADMHQASMKVDSIALQGHRTLWLEDIQATLTDYALPETSLSIRIFDTNGIHLGDFTADYQSLESGSRQRVRARLVNEDSGLKAALGVNANNYVAMLKGALTASQLDVLGGFAGLDSVSVDGGALELDVRLNGKPENLQGVLEGRLSEMALTIDENVEIRGLNTIARVDVNRFPRTRDSQAVNVERMSIGELILENIEFTWELPHWQAIKVSDIHAESGTAQFRIEGFTLNPLKPSLKTTLHLSNLEASRLVELMPDPGFKLNGMLEGKLPISFDGETWHIGEGELSLNQGHPQRGRFELTNPAILEDTLTSGAGRKNVQQLIVDAIQRGIDLDELRIGLFEKQDETHVQISFLISGTAKTDDIEVPVGGLRINNRISHEDLKYTLGLVGDMPIQFD